jgi:uncharacterized Ntn-hydrolase superfamily protein
MMSGKILMLFFLIYLFFTLSAQSIRLNQLAHTYSIVGVDSVTGEIGVAVQSHWFSVGSRVTWALAGVGAVATQSFTNPEFGPKGLELLKSGKSVTEVLDILIKEDEGRDYRQVALIDARGNSISYTGDKCITEAGHVYGKYYSAQANLMLKSTVWKAMEEAFKNTEAPLPERLVAALEAAENEGGDIRGKQSAALLVVKAKSTGKSWEDRSVDLRVEDHSDPIAEIKRLLKVHRAYEHMNTGDVALENGNKDLALQEYGLAEEMFPDNLEMKYWHAVSLVNIGKIEQALPIFQGIFQKDQNWHLLTPRLISPGLLKITENELKMIMELK